MNIEDFRNYCINKKQVTEHFPFDDDVLVFKVCNKMFALSSLKSWEANEAAINLKCNPEYAIELRNEYSSVIAGFHMHKKHWNTIHLYKNDLPPKLPFQLIDHSYDMVVKGLPKKLRNALL